MMFPMSTQYGDNIDYCDKCRAAPILVLISESGQYGCFHEVSESAIILLQIPILIMCDNIIRFTYTCLFY